MSRKKTIDPVAIARKAVDDWFTDILTSPEWLDVSYDHSGPMYVAITAVQDVLFESGMWSNEKPKDEEGQSLLREEAAKYAGYLVGLQLGLRLRGGA